MEGDSHVIRQIGRTLAVLLALTLFAALAATADAQAQSYTFTKIADSAEGLTPDRCPAINNVGQVAFTAFTAEGVQTIFRAEPDGTLTAIADDTGRFRFFGANPSINDQGEISFAAGLEKGGEAIVISKGKTLKIAARTEPGRFNFFGFNTSLNNLGEVVFTAELDEEFGFDEGTFVTDGSKIRTIYLASTSQFRGTDSRRSINDAGQIAFEEDLDDFTSGIFRFDPGSGFVTIVDENSPIVDFATDPQLNNAGVVVFHAFLDASPDEAIMTGSGRALTTVADTTGPFGSFAFFGGPSINDLREVAFGASLDGAFENGIYTGPDPIADRVIAPGDMLGGATVTNTVVCAEGLNNAGQIVFVADLQQGDEFRTAIFVATPSG
jgi:hypothetical protein